MSIIGFSGGILVSGGVFTVLLAVGLVPRFAGKTHTGSRILFYEEAVVFGTLFGNLLSAWEYPVSPGSWIVENRLLGMETAGIWQGIGIGILLVSGLFAGIFVGCLAMAITEMLDTIPIFSRRIRFRKGLGTVLIVTAVGKLAGSLYYFLGGFGSH